MLGIEFIKVQPTIHILQYKGGQVVREGAGLSFFYFAPTTSLVAVPIASVDVPFIFNEVTADFQAVTIQGQLTYKIIDCKKISHLLNFTLDAAGRNYVSDDPQKLPLRLISIVQVLIRTELQHLSLRDSLKASDILVQKVVAGLRSSSEINNLGVEILGLSILAIKPTPETSRALEAETREQLLKKADEAIYARRNAAVEQERAIKENELNTEIAVETKKRQVRETQTEAERSVQEKARQIRKDEMHTKIELEKKNQELVALASENTKRESDAKAYGISAVMKAISTTDPKILQALVGVGMEPAKLIAIAFQQLAENANKIGELNISPELLRELLSKQTQK